MGNRAVIVNDCAMCAEDKCIYLHWNGGKDSVTAFLRAAKELGMRFESNEDKLAFAEMLAERFFECKVGLTVYFEDYGRADTNNGDNGVFVVDDDFELVGRIYAPIQEQESEEKSQEIYEYLVGWEKAA